MVCAKIFCQKIYFLNIGIEPFKTNARKQLCIKICQLADFITVRDDDSFRILKNIGIKELKKSFDLAALLDFPNKNNMPKKKNTILGLSILPFYEIYKNQKNLDDLVIKEIAINIKRWLYQDPKNELRLFIFRLCRNPHFLLFLSPGFWIFFLV
jgi:polysaccharide pyruvyl transferase WcaK-like protein